MLIEIRIGPGKRELKSTMSKVKQNCRIGGRKIHRVPHLTLYGTFNTRQKNIKKIIKCIESVGKKYSYLPFTIDGFGTINGERGKVVYFNIIPSNNLKKFRRELARKLLRLDIRGKPWDRIDMEFLFHITLAYGLTDREFKKIWSHLYNDEKSFLTSILSLFSPKKYKKRRDRYNINLQMNGLRVTLLSNKSKIISEYDLVQKKTLSRRSALSRKEWRRTLKLLKN